jgi:hypothetical protein
MSTSFKTSHARPGRALLPADRTLSLQRAKLLAPLAVPASDGGHPRQDPRLHHSATMGRDEGDPVAQSRPSRLGRLLPNGQCVGEVQRGGQLRASAAASAAGPTWRPASLATRWASVSVECLAASSLRDRPRPVSVAGHDPLSRNRACCLRRPTVSRMREIRTYGLNGGLRKRSRRATAPETYQ